MNRKNLAALIKDAAADRGMRLVDLAAMVGISPSQLTGATLSGGTMREIAKILDLDAEDIEDAWMTDALAHTERKWLRWWGEG